MKTKVSKKLLNASLPLILCSSIFSGATASEVAHTGIYSSAFDDCFSEGYHLSELSKEQIYTTALCFSGLLDSEQKNITTLGASKLTILQYSDSWYQAAANLGHEHAQAKHQANRDLISSFEQETHFGIAPLEETMFASENLFKRLDVNKDGLLSAEEAASSPALKQHFAKADFDDNGTLSVGEYAIEFGEMTAAGK